jgi:hypothetical protein
LEWSGYSPLPYPLKAKVTRIEVVADVKGLAAR